ncbi:MAG: cytochrome c-type biogenesis protein [Pseudomonadota bacterium]
MMGCVRTLAAACLAAFIIVPIAAAVEPDEMLDDPLLETRAREISAEIRCVVCQNQSIDRSNAEMARDMRIIVRERLSAGDTNEEVLDYLVARYGDFVRFRPPFKASTVALWLTPFVLALIALLVGASFLARRSRNAALHAPPPLSAEERRVLERLRGTER